MRKHFSITIPLSESQDYNARQATKQAAVRFVQSLTRLSAKQSIFHLTFTENKLKIVTNDNVNDYTIPLHSQIELDTLKSICSKFNFASAFHCLFEGRIVIDEDEIEKSVIIKIYPTNDEDFRTIENFFQLIETI